MTTLSIIVPTLNEADGINAAMSSLQPLRDRGAEIIVVDGASDDRTADLARPNCDRLLLAPRGRAAQMNAGAAAAQGQILLFLHADTRLPGDRSARSRRTVAQPRLGSFRRAHLWDPSTLRGCRDADEHTLALDRHCHRRPSGLCRSARFCRRRRISGYSFDGRHCPLATTETTKTAVMPFDRGGHLVPSLGDARRPAYNCANVASTLGFFFGR
jgi:glycosyltransferase involved in cell wall biosynthesis